ncbi:hypothetical protein [Acinetobacter baumannii]|uniref:hypothetical protein n=1 Tax=Acinetobacter baumannii TaxID=470 RepID=UPI0031F2E387
MDVETPLQRWFGESEVERIAAAKVKTWLENVDLSGYTTAYSAFAQGDETGEVILNSYAIPAKVVPQVKPFKKGQCLEIKSKHGFFKDTGDGQYIESIQPCSKKGLATPKVTR